VKALPGPEESEHALASAREAKRAAAESLRMAMNSKMVEGSQQFIARARRIGQKNGLVQTFGREQPDLLAQRESDT
jgi:hypothetical protein